MGAILQIGQEIPMATGYVSAAHFNAVARTVNQLRKISSDGFIKVSSVGSGLIFSFCANSEIAVGKPWDISISGTTATFSNCGYIIGSQTIFLTDQTCEISGTGTTYIGLVYDSNNSDKTKAITVVCGGEGTAFDSTYNAQVQLVRMPLFKIDGSRVVVDYRSGLPNFGVYAS